MIFEWVNEYYNLNVSKGLVIKFKGDPVVVKGMHGCYLKVETKDKRELILHPTWEIEYPNGKGRRDV
jgi:hypothetical protein